MKQFLPWLLILVVVSCSCASLGKGGKSKQKPAPSPFGPTGIPPQLRAKNQDFGVPVGGGSRSAATNALNLPPEEDIAYTDPDNPDAVIPELATLLAQPKRGPWEQYETFAKQLSVREGKPLLIWFTDSMASPNSQALSQELFAKEEFGNWASEKLVRLKVDAHIEIRDSDSDLNEMKDRELRINDYNKELKKRYKVMGFPTLILVSPNGEVVGRYTGYQRGGAEYLWGQLKHGEAVSVAAYKGWRADLEKKGYREWRDRKDRKVFAKMTSYSKGVLTLVEPDGGCSRAQETIFSDQDRAWIAEQKKLMGVP